MHGSMVAFGMNNDIKWTFFSLNIYSMRLIWMRTLQIQVCLPRSQVTVRSKFIFWYINFCLNWQSKSVSEVFRFFLTNSWLHRDVVNLE